MLKINHLLLEQVLTLIGPCIEQVRQRYRMQGWIAFDGLLLHVRNLLRDYPLVREQMKQEYQAILIDEFQDTDPLQYEILLYLAECPGQHHRSWQDIRVVPGKLFIVGDPPSPPSIRVRPEGGHGRVGHDLSGSRAGQTPH